MADLHGQKSNRRRVRKPPAGEKQQTGLAARSNDNGNRASAHPYLGR